MADILLQETEDALLQENGSLILLEQQTDPPGGSLTKPRRHLGNAPGPKQKTGAGTFAYRLSISGVGAVDTIHVLHLTETAVGVLTHERTRRYLRCIDPLGIVCGHTRMTAVPSRSGSGIASQDPAELALILKTR